MPVTFGTFLVAALAISGVPPLNGFASKWMIYQGIIESARGGGHLWVLWLVAAMFGSALTLASFMKVVHAVFLGQPSQCAAPSQEPSRSDVDPVDDVGVLVRDFWRPGIPRSPANAHLSQPGRIIQLCPRDLECRAWRQG